jgi:hypothetical protein
VTGLNGRIYSQHESPLGYRAHSIQWDGGGMFVSLGEDESPYNNSIKINKGKPVVFGLNGEHTLRTRESSITRYHIVVHLRFKYYGRVFEDNKGYIIVVMPNNTENYNE